MDKIILPEIRIMACHGCFPEEKVKPQPFVIGLTLFLDLQPAGRSDDLLDTVDYGKLFLEIRELAVSHSYNLIEALAEAVAQRALAEALVEQVTVSVEKPEAKAAGMVFPSRVEIQRTKELCL
ncbi:MAG: dihydroneopterin aldolase [Firmicutes bacterium]|nr:dihydroneopterin aldolase [Bacillota bacterium]